MKGVRLRAPPEILGAYHRTYSLLSPVLAAPILIRLGNRKPGLRLLLAPVTVSNANLTEVS